MQKSFFCKLQAGVTVEAQGPLPSQLLSPHAHLCPLGARLVSIEDGSHRGEPLVRSLLRAVETIFQGHHNSPKLVFDIFLKGKYCYSLDQPPVPALIKALTSTLKTLKLRKKLREMDIQADKQ